MPKQTLLLFLSILSLFSCKDHENPYTQEIKAHQTKLNEDYFNPETSPLKPEELIAFKEAGGHDFYSINPNFKVMAYLQKDTAQDTVVMPTSSEKVKSFDTYGTAQFVLNGKSYSLKIYQNYALQNQAEYKDYLFLPFRDHTSGRTTYGGGRYIDLTKTTSDSIVIDFNKSYHPYCAYTTGYSCPIPPEENMIDLPIEAGIRFKGTN